MLTSATRRSRWPYDVPRHSTAATGAKKGVEWPNTALATTQATAAAIGALADHPGLGLQPANPSRHGEPTRSQARSLSVDRSTRLILAADEPDRRVAFGVGADD